MQAGNPFQDVRRVAVGETSCDLSTGVEKIEILEPLEGALRACVLAHELLHALHHQACCASAAAALKKLGKRPVVPNPQQQLNWDKLSIAIYGAYHEYERNCLPLSECYAYGVSVACASLVVLVFGRDRCEDFVEIATDSWKQMK